MWMIRWFLIAVAFFGTILFIFDNRDVNTVSINYIFGSTPDLSPLLLMLAAYFAGILTWLLISLFNYFKMRSELSSRDKLIKNLKQELNEYRNQSLAPDSDAEKTQILLKKEGTPVPPVATPVVPGTFKEE